MKTTLLATTVALCALCLVGCADETDETQQPQPGRQATMTMHASTAAPATRVHYTPGTTAEDKDVMHFSWDSGDKMSVCVAGVEGNENRILTTQGQGKSADFTGTVTAWEGTRNIYAISPDSQYSEITNADNPAEATTTLTIAPPINFNVDSKQLSNHYLVGTGTATATTDGSITASAAMKQVMSFVVVNIAHAPGKLREVRLNCNEKVFPARTTVKLSTGEITDSENPAKDFSVRISQNTYTETLSVIIPIFPVDLSGKKIQITAECQDGTTRTLEKDGIKFERNTHYVVDFDKGVPVWNNVYPSVPRAQQLLTATDETANAEDGKDHVFLISSKEQLLALHILTANGVDMPGAKTNKFYNYATYRLTEDIPLTGIDWRTIYVNFYGTFDGQGHTISDLNITGIGDTGLFKDLFKGGTIKNVAVKGNIENQSSRRCAGGIVANNGGTVAWCSFEGSISGSDAGGICGINTNSIYKGTVTSCFVRAKVSGSDKQGGIAGANFNSSAYVGTVQGCTWYSNPADPTDPGIEACYDGWTADADGENQNASYADANGLSARIAVMNSYEGDYQWVVEGTTLKLEKRQQP